MDTYTQEYEKLKQDPRVLLMKQYRQHAVSNTYDHVCHVAKMSHKIEKGLLLRNIDEKSMLRGAMLHDYYQYAFRDHPISAWKHGTTHAGKALENAKRDFILTPLEEDIIARHMFPLNLHPPGHRESALVCMADKVCSAYETAHRKSTPWRPYRLEEEMEAWLKQMK